MQIESIAYTEFENSPKEWRLKEAALGDITLLVGKNASGKSRTLTLLASLARLLSGDLKVGGLKSVNYHAKFLDGNTHAAYELVVRDGSVQKENFSIDGVGKLIRGPDGVGKIFSEKANELQDFQAPPSELAAVIRRDTLQHSFFERLSVWSNGVRFFQFGTSLGKENYAVIVNEAPLPFNPKETGILIPTFKKGEKEFGETFIKNIITDMAVLDYHLERVGVGIPESVGFQGLVSAPVGLYAKERNLNMVTEQFQMSQGMFRAFSILIQINYAQLAKDPSCIIIDDIGEGLDFERSCALVKLLTQKAQDSGVQLIMSTNDRFVMNKVPLTYWTVIQRTGNVCRFFNYSNSREKFDEFKFTGMNNFDFFATDFLELRSVKNEENSNLR